ARFRWMDAESLSARNLIPGQPPNPFAPAAGPRAADALPPGMSPPPGAVPLSPEKIEVEVWRYRFDAGNGQVHSERIVVTGAGVSAAASGEFVP
ncbi:MAG TPA: hypothetical protein VHB77_02045, partial [Planctomycetaceae bacterium]|nr:hypothetical protein [Planctomycetaceae bacterium]